MKFKKTMIVVGSAIALGACASESPSKDATNTPGMDIETATSIAALEINADGSDIEVADATADAPLLMRSCNRGDVRQRVVDQFDEDGDRQWGGGERPSMGAPFGRSHRGGADGGAPAHDADADHPARAERMRQWQGQFDADGSGELDETESGAMDAEVTSRCEGRKAALIAEFDADASGDLDETEWEAAHAAIRARFEERKAALVAEFEANGDGELDGEERRAARQSIAGQLRDRGQRGGFGQGGKGFGRGDGGSPPVGSGWQHDENQTDEAGEWGPGGEDAEGERDGRPRGEHDGGAPFVQ
jgi:hypothetical protein